MRVVIIGLGSIARKHINSVRKIDSSAEIIALRSGSGSDNFESVANIFSFDEIANINPDFAIISNPTSLHKETIERLSDYKIPLFIEKPLHSDLSIEKLAAELHDKNTPTYIACNLRFLNCIKYVKSVLNSKLTDSLNEVNIYCGSYLPDWRPRIDYRNSYSAYPESGGGVHLDLIHEIDYAYWIFGNPLKITRILKNNSTLDISSMDYANFILEYPNFCVSIILNYYRRDPVRQMELVFDDSTWKVDLLSNQIVSGGQAVFTSDQRIIDTYDEQMTYFVNTVLNKGLSFNDISSAFEVLKICLPA